MPLYFLHIRDGADLIVDEEGVNVPGIEDALKEAIQGARDILAEKLRAGEVLDGQQIEITDESGAIVKIVPFREVVRFSDD